MFKYITKNRIYLLLIIIANVLASVISHIASEMKSNVGLFAGAFLTLVGFAGLFYFVRIIIYKNDSEWKRHILKLILIYVAIKVGGSILISAVVFFINKLGLITVDAGKNILERSNFVFHLVINSVLVIWLFLRMDRDMVSA